MFQLGFILKIRCMCMFQGQCQPHLMETVKESVEGICLKIYHLSADYAKKIKEKHSELLKENGISGTLIYCAFCTTLWILYVACLYFTILLLISFLPTSQHIVINICPLLLLIWKLLVSYKQICWSHNGISCHWQKTVDHMWTVVT